MAVLSIGPRLILATALMLPCACAPKPIAEPPPQTPASTEPSAADAGLPMVPLGRKGVIVPSDVKLEPEPPTAQPAPGAIRATAIPNAN